MDAEAVIAAGERALSRLDPDEIALKEYGKELAVVDVIYTGALGEQNLEAVARDVYENVADYDFARFRVAGEAKEVRLLNRWIANEVERDYVEKRYMDEGALAQLKQELYTEIVEEMQPCAVIAILEGGRNLGEDFSFSFQVPHHTIAASHYDGEQRKNAVEIGAVSEQPDERCTGEDPETLIVDDCVDTGKTLEAVTDALEETHAPFVTAALHVKPWTRFWPDFYVEETTDWIIYPWEQDD